MAALCYNILYLVGLRLVQPPAGAIDGEDRFIAGYAGDALDAVFLVIQHKAAVFRIDNQNGVWNILNGVLHNGNAQLVGSEAKGAQ